MASFADACEPVTPDGVVARVGDHRDAGDPGRRVAAQEHERVRLLERRRRLDARFLAVVGAEPEPHLLVGLRERRVGRARAGSR